MALIFSLGQTALAEEAKPDLPVQASDRDLAPPVNPNLLPIVSGTRVRMKQPENFAPSKDFSGFANVESNASVMVTELPAPFAQATAGFTAEGLASKGMKLLSKSSVQVGNLPGLLVEIEQSAYGKNFKKWINAFGNSDTTFIVTATYPIDDEKKLSKSLKDAVLTASFDETIKSASPLEVVPFTISGGDNFKVAGVLQGTLMLTPTGKMGAATGKSSSAFVVGKALGPVPVGDKSAFAKARLMQTSKVSDIKIISEADRTIDAMPAREVVASAKEANGSSVLIFLTLVYPSQSYFIMQGIAELVDQDKQIEEFRTIAQSFKLKTK